MKSGKKKVKWNSDVEEFTTQAAWGGAQRDMAVVRAKLGCKHDVSEFYSPPRVVKMARKPGMGCFFSGSDSTGERRFRLGRQQEALQA